MNLSSRSSSTPVRPTATRPTVTSWIWPKATCRTAPRWCNKYCLSSCGAFLSPFRFRCFSVLHRWLVSLALLVYRWTSSRRCGPCYVRLYYRAPLSIHGHKAITTVSVYRRVPCCNRCRLHHLSNTIKTSSGQRANLIGHKAHIHHVSIVKAKPFFRQSHTPSNQMPPYRYCNQFNYVQAVVRWYSLPSIRNTLKSLLDSIFHVTLMRDNSQ